MRQVGSSRVRLFSGSILLVMLISQAAGSLPVRAASNHPKNFFTGQMVLEATQYPQSKKICQDTDIDLGYKVTNENINTPVPYATVALEVSTKSSGKATETKTVWPNGTVKFTVVLSDLGEVKLKATAQKPGYTNATLESTYEIVPCKWGVRVLTSEQRTIQDYKDLTVYAESDWTAILKIDPSQVNANNITIDSGQVTGQFKVIMFDEVVGPLFVSLEPTVDDQFERQVTAFITGNEIKLKFDTSEFPTPKQMKVVMYDVIGMETVQFKPPVDILPYFGQCLELNNLTDVTFPISGGVKYIYGGQPCFFEQPVKDFYIGIQIEPIKG